MAKKEIRNINWKYDRIQKRNRLFRSLSIGFTALCFVMITYYFMLEVPGKTIYLAEIGSWMMMALGGSGLIYYFHNIKIDETETKANQGDNL